MQTPPVSGASVTGSRGIAPWKQQTADITKKIKDFAKANPQDPAIQAFRENCNELFSIFDSGWSVKHNCAVKLTNLDDLNDYISKHKNDFFFSGGKTIYPSGNYDPLTFARNHPEPVYEDGADLQIQTDELIGKFQNLFKKIKLDPSLVPPQDLLYFKMSVDQFDLRVNFFGEGGYDFVNPSTQGYLRANLFNPMFRILDSGGTREDIINYLISTNVKKLVSEEIYDKNPAFKAAIASGNENQIKAMWNTMMQVREGLINSFSLDLPDLKPPPGFIAVRRKPTSTPHLVRAPDMNIPAGD